MADLRSCWSLVEVLPDIKNVFLKEISRPWFFCSPISSLSPQASLVLHLTIEQNAMGSLDHGLKPPKLWAKRTLICVLVNISCVYYSHKKLHDTYLWPLYRPGLSWNERRLSRNNSANIIAERRWDWESGLDWSCLTVNPSYCVSRRKRKPAWDLSWVVGSAVHNFVNTEHIDPWEYLIAESLHKLLLLLIKSFFSSGKIFKI